MDRRNLLFGAFAALASGEGLAAAESTPEHDDWVLHVLKRMLTIGPGMTRAQLLGPFQTTGGFRAPLHETFASRDCVYFSVDVVFHAATKPRGGMHGRVIHEDAADTIATISRPYLGYPVYD